MRVIKIKKLLEQIDIPIYLKTIVIGLLSSKEKEIEQIVKELWNEKIDRIIDLINSFKED